MYIFPCEAVATFWGEDELY